MAKRGRPRHPDILTPREWEVLALLREGLTNEQIAERLGTTERTARYHVSEILSKLGVSTRQEAASWEPEAEERRAWWGALPWLSLKKGWLAATLVAIVTGAGIASAGVIVFGILRTHGKDHLGEAVYVPPTGTSRACPTPGGSAIVDYVDFFKFRGVRYMAQDFQSPADLRLGPKVGQVECKIADTVGNASYQAQDGDAAYLEPGTAIYAIDGYDMRFRLAARRLGGNPILYEAFDNPQARVGADLLDIDSRVQYIGVNSQTDGGTQLAEITTPAQVDALVAFVLNAPVHLGATQSEGDSYSLVFHLRDGTSVSRTYWLSTGELWPGVSLPSAFGEAVREALASHTAR